MRTARSLTVARSIGGGGRTCRTCPLPHIPPPTCPPAMHVPLPCMPPCHVCPLPHMLPATHASLPCMPPCHVCPPAMHTPTAMHAPLPRTPLCEQKDWLLWKNYLAATSLRAVKIIGKEISTIPLSRPVQWTDTVLLLDCYEWCVHELTTAQHSSCPTGPVSRGNQTKSSILLNGLLVHYSVSREANKGNIRRGKSNMSRKCHRCVLGTESILLP